MPQTSRAGDAIVFKVCRDRDWRAAVASGGYSGSAADRQDGFIHLSAAHQLAGTLARHYAGQADLVLIAVSAARLGGALRWEPSRGGDLFPHLYAPLPVAAALQTWPIAAGFDGVHVLPDLAAMEKPAHD